MEMVKRRWHTDNTNEPSLRWYKIHHLDLLKSTSPHHPTTTSLQTTTTFASHNPFTTFSQSTPINKMAFFKSLLIASVAAVAFAAPQGGASDGNKKIAIDSSSSETACGNGQKLACCNSGEDLIGANCLSVPIRKPLQFLSIHATPANNVPHSRHSHPAGLRLQRRRMLPDW
jgi:hypothetical protein